MAACGSVLMCVLLLTLTIGTSGKRLTTVTVKLYSLVPANNDSIKK